jgi:hypothetical protein
VSKPRVLIATPVMASEPEAADVKLRFMTSMLQIVRTFNGLGFMSGSAFTNTDLVRARSRAVRCALDECFTHLLFWDSDVGGDVSGALQGMLSCGVDFIACPYPRKNLSGRMTHEPPFVAMGFTLLSEACLRNMWDAHYDELAFDDIVDGKAHRSVALFQLILTDVPGAKPHRALLGEDFSFCERWLRLDGEIHLYEGPGSPLDHAGGHVFKGDAASATP